MKFLEKEFLALEAMLDHLDEAVLFFDRKGFCLPISSRASEIFLSCKPEGQSISKLLDLPEERTWKWIETLYTAKMPFKDLAYLGPKNTVASNGRKLALRYFPVYEKDSELRYVGILATDKTKEVEAEQREAKEKLRTQQLIKLTKFRFQFFNFVQDADTIFKELEKYCAAEIKQNFSLEEVMRLLHTFKGGAASFSMDEAQRLAHELETDCYSKKIKSNDDLRPRVQKISMEFIKFITDNQYITGVDAELHDRLAEIPVSDLQNFSKKLEGHLPARELKQDFERSFLTVPIGRLFAHYRDVVSTLAQQFNKELIPTLFTGEDLRIVPETYTDLASAFVHAFVNAIDHGIELPADRLRAGKPPKGRIELYFLKEVQAGLPKLRIVLTDDGRGISAEKIRAKMRSLGKIELAERESDQEIIQFIFESGVSTKETLTAYSGRGVGMDAIREAARELGGDARVDSRVGSGTTLTVFVPLIGPHS